MSRRSRTFKREIIPDPVHKDIVIAKFVNKIMLRGQKSTAQKLFYGALEELNGKVPGEDSVNVMRKALENVKPSIEVRSRRVGGATYQVPMDVRPERRQTLGIRWIIRFAGDRREKGMTNKLANELISASNGEGSSVKKREDTHRMAEANKAFAHFKW